MRRERCPSIGRARIQKGRRSQNYVSRLALTCSSHCVHEPRVESIWHSLELTPGPCPRQCDTLFTGQTSHESRVRLCMGQIGPNTASTAGLLSLWMFDLHEAIQDIGGTPSSSGQRLSDLISVPLCLTLCPLGEGRAPGRGVDLAQAPTNHLSCPRYSGRNHGQCLARI